MSKKTTKRALAMSFVSVFLCVCMLVGTTFAWFTDSVTSSNNIIKSGTLDVEMYWAKGNEAVPTTDAGWTNAASGAIFKNDLWEPGYTEVRHIKIENKGTLALKYQLSITADGEVTDLADVIDVYYLDPAEKIADRTELNDSFKIGTLSAVLANIDSTASTTMGELLAGDNHTVTIALKMQEDATNEYQGLSIGSDFSVVLMATQKDYESDSFNNQYDANAKFDVSVWDGKTVTAPVADADGVYHITTAAELVGMMNVTGNSIYKGKTIVLDNNIDLGGRTVKGIGGISTNFAGVFDGQGYTISNFKVDSTENSYYAGLFNQVSHGGTIKNLTVKNATIVGKSMVGAIASSVDSGATIDNCKAIDCTLIGVKKVGAVVGYSAGSTVTNNHAENCSVYYSEKDGGEILGYEYTGSTVSNNTAKNVSVKQGVVVSSADELTDAIASGASTVVLGNGNYIIPDSAQGRTLTIVGNGNTVVATQDDGSYEGCDYSLDGATVTFEGVTINTDSTTYTGYARCKGTYNNCTINGTFTLYDNSTFNNCTFNVSGDVYNIWTWGAPEATFNNCTFNSDGKALLLYGTANTKLTLNDCTFNDKGGLTDLKAAIEIGNDYNKSYELIVNDTVVNGYEINDKGINTGSTLWANKNSMPQDKLNVVVDGVDVY